MSLLIKDLDIDSHRVLKCFIVPYKDRAQLVIGNKCDEGKTYDIFEVLAPHGDLIDRDKLSTSFQLVNDFGDVVGVRHAISINEVEEAPVVIESEY